jgi:hypothetical protein
MNSDGRQSPADDLAPAPWMRVFLVSLGLAIVAHSLSGANSAGNTFNTPQEIEAALKKAVKVEQGNTNIFRIGLVELDKEKRTVSVKARVCLRTQVVEYALVTEKGKAYESLLTTEAAPADLHLAFLLLGIGQGEIGSEFGRPMAVPATNAVKIQVTWSNTNGQLAAHSLAELVVLATSQPELGKPMVLEKWFYNGSVFDSSGFAAQQEGSIVSLIRDPLALINNPGGDRDNDNIHFPNARLLPVEGSPVRMIFQLPPSGITKPARKQDGTKSP